MLAQCGRYDPVTFTTSWQLPHVLTTDCMCVVDICLTAICLYNQVVLPLLHFVFSRVLLLLWKALSISIDNERGVQAKQDSGSLVWIQYQRFARRSDSVRASRQVSHIVPALLHIVFLPDRTSCHTIVRLECPSMDPEYVPTPLIIICMCMSISKACILQCDSLSLCAA